MSQSSLNSKSAIAPVDSPPLTPHQTRRKRWLWLVLGAVGLIGGWLIWSWIQRDESPDPTAAQATVVETETVQTNPVKVTSEFVGSLETQERVQLRPEVEGRITQIFVKNGDRVSPGTPILQLSSERPQALMSGAIADISVARAAQRADQAQLLEAEANRDNATAEKKLQDTEFKRIQTLVREGALPRQSLDQVIRNRDAAIASLKAGERRIQTARANLEEATASLRRAESNVAVATLDSARFSGDCADRGGGWGCSR